MPEFLRQLFSSDAFMPHGHCYLWNPGLILLHVISDALIALSYMSIPFTLLYLTRKRKDIPFSWMVFCFEMFIIACGATHFMEIWTLWIPTYWLSGAIKAVTAAASVPTAVLLVKLVPRALAIPTAAELAQAHEELGRAHAVLESRVQERTAEVTRKNEELEREIVERKRAEESALAITRSRDELVRQHADHLRQILHASREFSGSLNLTYVVSAVRASTADVGGYKRVIVWLMEAGDKRLLRAKGDQKANEREAASHEDGALDVGQSLAGRSAKWGRVTFECADGQVRFNDGDTAKAPVYAIAIPLIVGARVVGVLEARQDEPQVTTGQAIEVLEMFAMHAATAIEAARLYELSEGRGQLDALTRLLNRRRLDEDLDAECKRCARYARPLAFVMLDVDHFKAYNDAHGHPHADEALRELANVMASAMRATDTAYRYGGEEFCVLLRETSGADAMIFAERLRDRIEQRFASGTHTGLTASLGVSEFSPDRPTSRELVEAADIAMYQSKQTGRNRVVLSSPPPLLAKADGGQTRRPADS